MLEHILRLDPEVYFEKAGDEDSKKLGVITIPSFYNDLSRDVKKFDLPF